MFSPDFTFASCFMHSKTWSSLLFWFLFQQSLSWGRRSHLTWSRGADVEHSTCRLTKPGHLLEICEQRGHQPLRCCSDPLPFLYPLPNHTEVEGNSPVPHHPHHSQSVFFCFQAGASTQLIQDRWPKQVLFFCFRAFRTKRKGAELFVGLFTEQQRFLLALVSLAGFCYRLVWWGNLMQNQKQHMVKDWPIMQLAAFPRSFFQYPRALRICWQFDFCCHKSWHCLSIGPGTKWSCLLILFYKATAFVFLEKKKINSFPPLSSWSEEHQFKSQLPREWDLLIWQYSIQTLRVQQTVAPRCAHGFYFIYNDSVSSHLRNSENLLGVNSLSHRGLLFFIQMRPWQAEMCKKTFPTLHLGVGQGEGHCSSSTGLDDSLHPSPERR